MICVKLQRREALARDAARGRDRRLGARLGGPADDHLGLRRAEFEVQRPAFAAVVPRLQQHAVARGDGGKLAAQLGDLALDARLKGAGVHGFAYPRATAVPRLDLDQPSIA
ncbi:MAG: hypothetical protein WD775_07380 [Burkholderiales bacterium]